jgi:flagellin-like hook-associated protein FlgL
MSVISNPTNLEVNISSLLGRLSLKRSETALNTAIRNLQSGIRIHSAKDDPVGFVAGTAMQTDISSTQQAVANSERASAVIATADSALSHLNNLLNDLRGLITEAANTGAENQATLAALQINTDAVLNAIDFISESTTFQNQKLLNGSLDFTTFGLNQSKVSKLEINQADFLGRTEKDIDVQILTPASQGTLYYPYGALKQDTIFSVGGTSGYQTFNFDGDATVYDIADAVNRFSDSTGVGAAVYASATPGNLVLTSYGKDNDIIVTASSTGEAAGNFVFRFTQPGEQNDEAFINFTEGSGNDPAIIEIVLKTDAEGNVLSTANDIADLINTSPLLKNGDGSGRLSATIPASQTGSGMVTPFKESAYYGSVDTNNLLQFLAPEGSPKIRLTSSPNTPLSVSEASGMLVVNLETDANGIVKTTANDLVRFFDNPSTDEAKAVLDKYGISVSSIDPKNSNLPVCAGDSPSGIGALVPTYDPLAEGCPPDGLYYPDIVFSSYGEGIVEDYASATITGTRGRNADFTITATQRGAAYNNTQVVFTGDADGPSLQYNPVLKRLTIGLDPKTDTAANDIIALINGDETVSKFFAASLPETSTGEGFVTIGNWSTMTGGIKDASVDNADLTPAELGVRMFSGSDCASLGITFFTVGFGSGEFVDVQALQDSEFPLADRFGNVTERSYGTDVVAKINGQMAIGDGRIARSAASNLDMSIWTDPNVQSGDVFGFRITGGGTLIQLGQNAVSELQARIRIPSVHTTALGGLSGYLSELKTGGRADLTTDTNAAFRILEEVTEQVTSLRGRLGAFQKTRLETNIANLTDTINIETGAKSEITDSDFAEESSNLTKQQLLMQTSVTVLQQTRMSQQLLLSLLQG